VLTKLFLLLLITSSLRAEIAEKGNCSVSWELFRSPAEFDLFYSTLKTSAQSKNKISLAELSNFPLNTMIGHKMVQIKTKQEFLQKFDKFYSPSITEAILKQDPKTVFCNSQGMMIGNGHVWVSRRGNKTGIITINRSAK